MKINSVELLIRDGKAFWQLGIEDDNGDAGHTVRGNSPCEENCPQMAFVDCLHDMGTTLHSILLKDFYKKNPEFLDSNE